MDNLAVIIWTTNFNNTINSKTNAKTIYIMNLIYLKQLFVYELFIGSAQIAHVQNFQLSMYHNLDSLWAEIKRDFSYLMVISALYVRRYIISESLQSSHLITKEMNGAPQNQR